MQVSFENFFLPIFSLVEFSPFSLFDFFSTFVSYSSCVYIYHGHHIIMYQKTYGERLNEIQEEMKRIFNDWVLWNEFFLINIFPCLKIHLQQFFLWEHHFLSSFLLPIDFDRSTFLTLFCSEKFSLFCLYGFTQGCTFNYTTFTFFS